LFILETKNTNTFEREMRSVTRKKPENLNMDVEVGGRREAVIERKSWRNFEGGRVSSFTG